jgi:hypothetical protein
MRGGCCFLEGKALTGDAGMRDGGYFFRAGFEKMTGVEIRKYAAPFFSTKKEGFLDPSVIIFDGLTLVSLSS